MAKSNATAVTTEKVGTEGKLIREALKMFGPPLLAVSKRWESKLRGRTAEDVQLFYEMAKDVVEIDSNADKYGDDAVDRLWHVHHLDETAKKFYLLVGTAIKQELFDAITAYNLSEKAVYAPVSTSHLLLIASLPTDKAKQKCLSLIQYNQWGVKSTKAWVDEHNDKLGEKEAKPKRIVAMFGKIAKSAKQLLDASDTLADEGFIENLSSVDPKDITTAIERCVEIRDSIQNICASGADRVITLDNAIERLSAQRAATQARLAAKNQELEDRKTTGKRKLMAAAGGDGAASKNGVVQGIVTSSSTKSPAAKSAAKPAVVATAKPAERQPVPKRVPKGSSTPAAKPVPVATKQVTKSPTNPPMPAKKKKLIRRVVNPS